MSHLPWLIFVTAYGAIVGSFVNVVIYRLPEGKGVIWPPSSCPKCGKRLAWYDNVPVLGWLWLRGKCRQCRAPISIQYPLIEALCAALFALVYWATYISGFRPVFMELELAQTWPMLIMELIMVAGLLAATVIDARLFIIPLRIPHVITVIAVIGLPLSVIWVPGVARVASLTTTPGIGAAAGGVAGLALALALLHFKILPLSFEETEEALNEDQPADAFFYHPHPRREVLKECLFVALPAVGAAIGYAVVSQTDALGPPGNLSIAIHVFGGAVCGYLVGGGIVWGIRIIGTLAFGREAMGLGDVHLLAGIGAVIGWRQAITVFFVAPFLGLVGAAASHGLSKLLKSEGRVIPYGPYLAGATLIVLVAGETLPEIFGILGH